MMSKEEHEARKAKLREQMADHKTQRIRATVNRALPGPTLVVQIIDGKKVAKPIEGGAQLHKATIKGRIDRADEEMARLEVELEGVQEAIATILDKRDAYQAIHDKIEE